MQLQAVNVLLNIAGLESKIAAEFLGMKVLLGILFSNGGTPLPHVSETAHISPSSSCVVSVYSSHSVDYTFYASLYDAVGHSFAAQMLHSAT